MATTFGTIDTSRTALGMHKFFLDTIAHNIANVNTVRPADQEPFRARLVRAVTLDDARFSPTGSGVAVAQVLEVGGDAPRVQDPDSPLADADGYVTRPLVDLASQMADLMIAQRGYQANLRAISTAKEAYEAALTLGRS
jgi:flagellar basal-body rod protein FlgC